MAEEQNQMHAQRHTTWHAQRRTTNTCLCGIVHRSSTSAETLCVTSKGQRFQTMGYIRQLDRRCKRRRAHAACTATLPALVDVSHRLVEVGRLGDRHERLVDAQRVLRPRRRTLPSNGLSVASASSDPERSCAASGDPKHDVPACGSTKSHMLLATGVAVSLAFAKHVKHTRAKPRTVRASTACASGGLRRRRSDVRVSTA